MKLKKLFLSIIFMPMILYGTNNNDFTVNLPDKFYTNSKTIVNIEINNDNINGFAKFEIIFPFNVSAKTINNSGALLVSKNNIVKFIWIDFPKQPIIKLSVELNVLDIVNTNNIIKSSFYYLENKNVKSINKEFTAKIDFNNFLTYNNTDNIKLKKRFILELNTKLNRDLIYQVQILAVSKKASKLVLNSLLDNDFEIKYKYEVNLYKYYVGNFYSLETALNFIKYSGIEDAFVVPYYNGNKITIKESKEIILGKELTEK
jgi:hypothetical protein